MTKEQDPLPDTIPQPVQPEINQEKNRIPGPLIDGTLERIDEIEEEIERERGPNKKGPTIH